MSRVRVIIKLGGAAITDKEQFETAKQDVIQQLAQQIANMLTCQGGAAIIVHGAGRCCCRSDIGGLQFISVQQSSDCYMCACSFGHHQASQYGVAAGGISRPDVRHGFALTRQSVLKLNQLVLSALIEGKNCPDGTAQALQPQIYPCRCRGPASLFGVPMFGLGHQQSPCHRARLQGCALPS